jgi:hypothetical protein
MSNEGVEDHSLMTALLGAWVHDEAALVHDLARDATRDELVGATVQLTAAVRSLYRILDDLADLAPDSNLRIFLEHVALRDAQAA